MSYLLSWSIYLWDQLEGVCVEKNAPQEEVSTWIWYQQLFTQRRTFKKKMSPLQIERMRHTKVSAGIYYRQLFAKKENLQYKEMIEISRWSLDRSHPYGLWFIYWDPPKIQTSYIRRTGGNTRLSKEILFLIRGVLKTALQEGILVKPRTLSRTYQRGKNPPRFSICVSNDFLCQKRVLQNTQKPFRKKNWCRSVALVTRYDVISSMKSIYF